LNIVDLAGSERTEKPYALEDSIKTKGTTNLLDKNRLDLVATEAKFINKSLSTLGRIFSMLSDRKAQNP
jgi:hypothetical protein